MTELEIRRPAQPGVVTEDSVLALVASGHTDLQRAVDVGDPALVADVVRRADAIRYLSKKAKLAIGAVNAAARLKTDAEWHAGNLLRAAKEAGEYGPGKQMATPLPFSHQLLHRWQDMSQVSRDDIDAYYKSQEQKQAEIASSAIAHMGARIRRMEKITKKQETYEEAPTDERPVPVIYADPPWRYEFSVSDSRQIENQYPTMTVEDIAAMDPAPEEDAVLFMWVTSPKLPEGLQVMQATDDEADFRWVKARNQRYNTISIAVPVRILQECVIDALTICWSADPSTYQGDGTRGCLGSK